MSAAPAVSQPPLAHSPVRTLEIDGVSKRYGELVALENLTFAVRAGELFGFVGRNGAGKTTTMRIVLGVLNADSGEVRWAGRPLDFATRRRIGYMPEERGLYPKMRLLDQLAYLGELHGMPDADARQAAGEWLERFGLADRRDGELQALSHGNQQRMQLAAALVCEPEILILDEPFSGLDPVALDVMIAVLRERAQAGVAVVFSSHELDLVERICDRVGIIDRHHLVACGTVAELRAGGQRRVWIDAPAAPAGWVEALQGVTAVGAEGGRTLLELAPGTNDQTVLRAALRSGPVHEFRPAEASLSEIFRDAIGMGQP
ncbi:MAG: ATP-binding cassette domain-containing protein [Chloroflexota bacterium]|nr:MAG: ATP-binding cassette domain-containing protein [Chloroflexota bacterium]